MKRGKLHRNGKNEGFFSRNYSASYRFFKEIKWHTVVGLGVISLSFLIGFIFPLFFREEIFQFILDITMIFEGKSVLWMIKFIFFNNLKASFLAIIFGIGFGIIPFFMGVMNGYIIGFVARETVALEGIFVLWKFLPHGIFELPAILLSIGIGFKIGTDLFRQNQKFKYNLREGLRFFVFVVFPLLLVAGIIEGFLIGIFS